MPFIVQEAVTEDVERLSDIQYAAFAGDPWGRIMFPTTPPPPGADTPTKRRYSKLIESDPDVAVMKVVDTDSNEMVGFARWELFFKERPESEWKTNLKGKREEDEGANAEAIHALITAVSKAEERSIAGRPHCCKYIVAYNNCQCL